MSVVRWQVQEAKQRFGEVLKAAESEPQIVTDHGEEIAVVVDIEEYRRLTDGRVGLMEYLRVDAVAESDDFAGDRTGDLVRDVDLEG
jgi:prevent-host-death family protein